MASVARRSLEGAVASHPRRTAANTLKVPLLGAGAAGLALCAATVWVTLSGLPSDAPGLAAFARALMVGAPIAVGLYAYYRQPTERFGPLLAAAGFGWFLTTLAESSSAVLYSIGRISGWLVEVGLVCLVLAFPTGRLRGRVDRALVLSSVLLCAMLYLPTALLARHYPVPAPWTSCQGHCPHNAFFAGSQPGVVDSIIIPLREVLTVLVFGTVILRLATRIRSASRLTRRTLTPVLLVAIAHLALLSSWVVARRAGVSTETAAVGAWSIALTLPAMAVAFLVGLIRWRLFTADALQRLALRLPGTSGREELTRALSEGLEDPALQVGYWQEGGAGGFVDGDGHSGTLAAGGPDRCITEVHDLADRRLAAIVHDAALRDHPQLVNAAVSYARIALENQRLSAKVEASLEEVRESRSRIQATADRERQRIERDLHDGAQQRLVALRIKLELVEELIKQNPTRGLERLHALGEEVTEALDEIRDLAHGVYPSLLADRGLEEALRVASLHGPVPVTVAADGIGRYPDEVESAVYFCCLEALQNASKHADGASAITIDLADEGGLRFQVRDDGGGFNGRRRNGGLTNMRDRLAAVGGRLDVRSVAGGGVTVSGSVPLG